MTTTKPEITYCDWEGDPAIVAEYPDGRQYGFAHMEGHWKGNLRSTIVGKAKVIGKDTFHRLWPGLVLPALPK